MHFTNSDSNAEQDIAIPHDLSQTKDAQEQRLNQSYTYSSNSHDMLSTQCGSFAVVSCRRWAIRQCCAPQLDLSATARNTAIKQHADTCI